MYLTVLKHILVIKEMQHYLERQWQINENVRPVSPSTMPFEFDV